MKTQYKPIYTAALEAGDVVKINRNYGNPAFIRADDIPTNSGHFSGHDRTGRKYYHLYIYRDVIQAYRKPSKGSKTDIYPYIQ